MLSLMKTGVDDDRQVTLTVDKTKWKLRSKTEKLHLYIESTLSYSKTTRTYKLIKESFKFELKLLITLCTIIFVQR